MPDMNGRQLAEELGRSDPHLKVQPFTPGVLIAEVRQPA